MKKILAVLIALLALTACTEEENAAPAADSDSAQEYKESKIPVDDNVYDITGEVVSDVDSLTRQTKPGGGSISAPVCAGTSGCFGGGGGTLFGPTVEGKGYVRLKVLSSKPSTDLAPEGQVVIIKATDTKASILLPGDRVTFRCRRQYEAVAAVRENQSFKQDEVATWELDYCRLSSPVIDVKGVKP